MEPGNDASTELGNAASTKPGNEASKELRNTFMFHAGYSPKVRIVFHASYGPTSNRSSNMFDCSTSSPLCPTSSSKCGTSALAGSLQGRRGGEGREGDGRGGKGER